MSLQNLQVSFSLLILFREYPVAEDRNGRKEDYTNFGSWMKQLKAAIGTKGLSVTLPSSYWYLQHFDIASLEEHIDWFNVSYSNYCLVLAN